MARMTAPGGKEIVVLRIEPVTDPLVCRQVAVPTAITLKPCAMSSARPGGGSPTIRPDKIRPSEIFKRPKSVLDWIYDFRDSWEQRLTLTDARPAMPHTAYPRYVTAASGPRRRRTAGRASGLLLRDRRPGRYEPSRVRGLGRVI